MSPQRPPWRSQPRNSPSAPARDQTARPHVAPRWDHATHQTHPKLNLPPRKKPGPPAAAGTGYTRAPPTAVASQTLARLPMPRSTAVHPTAARECRRGWEYPAHAACGIRAVVCGPQRSTALWPNLPTGDHSSISSVPCPVSRVSLIETLGSPICASDACVAFPQNKPESVRSLWTHLLLLLDPNDLSSTSLLFRVSRPLYLFRTTLLHLTATTASFFTHGIRGVFEKVHGPVPSPCWDVAQLPTALGDLGLTSALRLPQLCCIRSLLASRSSIVGLLAPDFLPNLDCLAAPLSLLSDSYCAPLPSPCSARYLARRAGVSSSGCLTDLQGELTSIPNDDTRDSLASEAARSADSPLHRSHAVHWHA